MRNDGDKPTCTHEELEAQFKQPAMKFAPYQFWFWDQDVHTLGNKPADMASLMAERGFNPGYAHARTNYAAFYGKKESEYINPLPKEQWLTAPWFDEFAKVAKQARSDHAHFSFTDEFGWPSLQAAGAIVAEDGQLAARSLRFAVTDVGAGQQAALPAADFTVSARVVRTEKSSYAAYYPNMDSWSYHSFFLENTSQAEVATYPLNMGMRHSAGMDENSYVIIRPYFAVQGTYKVYARWSDTGDNTVEAVYHIIGAQQAEVAVNQREHLNRWVLLGTCDFAQGNEGYIRLENRASGNVVFDAIKLVDEHDADNLIVVDDWHTTNRTIATLDSSSLQVLDPALAGNSWTAPTDGSYRVYSFTIVEHRGYDGGTVDYLNKSLAERFIRKAYQPYVERMGGFMGKTMNGVFSDNEGDYGYKLAWSESLEAVFRETTGEELCRMLPLLLDRDVSGMDARMRYAWFDAVSELYTGNFAAVADYARQHGMYYTMHTWEESLQLQASCVGDYFKLARALTMPGTDCLLDSVYNPAMFKETMSVAEFEQRRWMTEVMALLQLERYHPIELKKQANCMAAWGVSHIVTHAVKMTRDMAQQIVTPDFFTQDTMWSYMHHWTGFMRRTSFINSHGCVHAKVLLLSPMDSVWALAENDVFDMNYVALDTDGSIPKVNASYDGKVSEINRIYTEAMRLLTQYRVEHLVADKHYLNQMRVAGAALVRDPIAFQAVIMPPMYLIDRQSAERLVQFARSGGYVYYLGQLPRGSVQAGRHDPYVAGLMEQLKQMSHVHYVEDMEALLAEVQQHRDQHQLQYPKATPPLDQSLHPYLVPQVQFVANPFPLLAHYRIINNKHFIWVANNNGEDYHSVVHIPGITGGVTIWNPEDGMIRTAKAWRSRGGMEVEMDVARYQGFYIVIDPDQDQDQDGGAVLEAGMSVGAGAGAGTSIDVTRSGRTLVELDSLWNVKLASQPAPARAVHGLGEPVRTDKIRVVCHKGSFDNPRHIFISQILVNGHVPDVRIRASSEKGLYLKENIIDPYEGTYWSNKAPIIYDEAAWIELEWQKPVEVNSITIVSKEADCIRKYRIEAWDGAWWRTVASADYVIEPELINPIAYSEEFVRGCSKPLCDWKEWGIMERRFSGFVDYTTTFMMPVLPERVAIDLGEVRHMAELWINDVWIGSAMWPPYVYDITEAVREGVNHIQVRVGNLIADNAGLDTGKCGLLGPVRISGQ